MPSLQEILSSPDYANANEATKEAIFNKYAPQDANFAMANEATQQAIRGKYGIGAQAPAMPDLVQEISKTAPVQWIKDQAGIIRDDLSVGMKNTNIAVQNAKLAGIMEIQEARLAKYGSVDKMPEDVRKDYESGQASISKTLGKVGETAAEIRGIQKTGAQRETTKQFNEMQQSPEYKDGDFMTKLSMTGDAIMRDPIGIAVDLGLQSLPQSMAVASSAMAARVGMLNPTMAAAAGGATSAMMEFGNQYADLRAQGMPHEEAWQKAAVKSGIIGLFDAASFGSAGKAAGTVMRDLERGAIAQTAKDVAKETGKQSLYGASGEALGSVASNQDVDPAQVAAEAIGEVFGAPGEAVGTYQSNVSNLQNQRVPSPTGELQPPQIPEIVSNVADKQAAEKIAPEPVTKEEVPTAKVPQSESQDLEAMLAELTGEQPVQMEKSQVPVEEKPAPTVEGEAPEKAEAIIQNRNRATPASVHQMNQIANKLDYDLVKYSPTLADGAPVVAGNAAFSDAQLGKKDVVTGSDGSKIPVQYAVVSANEVLPSNNVDGSMNKEFFDPNYEGLKAISGNARTAGIQAAYDRGNANDYAARLTADDMHGISPQVVASIPNPMLVRLMPPEYVTPNIGDISNVASNLTMSAVEQAKNDSNRVDMRGLDFDPNGNISLNAIRGFIAAMPTSEQANLIDQNGMPSKQAYDRMEAAIFSSAYNSEELVRIAHQSADPESRNIIRAAAEAAPQMLRLEGAGNYDVRQSVVQGIEKAISARRSGISLDEAARQADMAIDPLANQVVQMFAENSRSAKAIGTALKSLADAAYEESQVPESGLFGETPKRPAEEIATEKLAPAKAPVAKTEDQQYDEMAKETYDALVAANNGSTEGVSTLETLRENIRKNPLEEARANHIKLIKRIEEVSAKEAKAKPKELDKLAQDLYSSLLELQSALNKPAREVTPLKKLRKEIESAPVAETRKRLKEIQERVKEEKERIDLEGERLTYGWKGSKFSEDIDNFITHLYGLEDEAYALKYDREMARKHKAGQLKTLDDVAKDVREHIKDLKDKREEEVVAGTKPHYSAVEEENVEEYKKFAEELMGKGKRTENVEVVTKNGKKYDQWSVSIVSNLSKAQATNWLENFGGSTDVVLVDEPRNKISVSLSKAKTDAVMPGRKYTMTWNATVEHVPADVRAAKMKEVHSRMQELNRSTERFPGTNYDLTLDQIKDKYRMASLAQINADIKRLDNSLASVEKRKAQKVEELWRGTEFEGRIDKMLSDLRKAGADDFAAMLNIGINNDIRDGKLKDISFREESARKELARLGERKPVKYEPMTAKKLSGEIESLGSLPEEIQNAAVDKWNSIAPKLYEMGFRFRETRGVQDKVAQDLDKQLGDIYAYVSDLAGRRYESAMLENRQFKTDDARIKAINNSEKQLAKAEVNATEAIGFETARHPGVDTSRPMDVYGSYVEQIKPESISFAEDKKLWDQAIAKVTRDEKIAEYAGLRRSKTAVEKRFVEDRSKPLDENLYKRIHERANILKKEIADTYVPDTSAENFMANATRALANESISRETYDAINLAFQKHPNLLDGLRLSVRQAKRGEASRGAAGNFDPFERIVTLFKFTNGTENPSTIRHELTHGMEQMMPEEARIKVVDAWATALEKAVKAEKSEAGKKFFSKVEEFIDKPSKESLKAAIAEMPNLSYYQYVNPSEYWAVNAEKLLAANMGGVWQRFKSAMKMWYQGLRKLFGASNTWTVNRVFRSILGNERMTSAMLNDYVSMAVDLDSFSNRKNFAGKKVEQGDWNTPDESKLDTIIYNLQDKHIDMKRVIEQVEKKAGQLEEAWNPYMKEELYHGRTAEQTGSFLRKEVLPILREMKDNDISAQQFDDYLHNRHAQERNEQIAKVNLEMPDGGSGIKTEDAIAYLRDIPADRKKVLEDLAKKVDSIVHSTQEILVKNGLEERETIKAWNKTYKHYVPLQRDDIEFVQGKSTGMGAGYGVRGSSSKRAVGSEKAVVDIFANIAAQRERAIVRSEKARVGRALYGLAIKQPNPEFWLPVNPDAIKNKSKLKKELESMGLDAEDAQNLMEEPKHPEIDPETGLVHYKIRSYLRNSDNVFPVRVNGKDRYIFFNSSNPRAMRMVESIKNLDAEQLGMVMGMFGRVTRWISSVNTQYNPVFGAWNFARDLEGSALNISTTPLAGHEKQIIAGVFPALKGIWSYMREEREGKEPSGKMADTIRSFREHGGQTGYRDQFTRNKEAANLIEREMGKLGRGNASKTFHYFAGLLSDYNDTMENAVRVSAYKTAIDNGFSEDKAASIAKNLTVNFNRKGKMGPTLGALYAFFNASMQGTARIYETLTGPAGRKIVAGGIALGVLQAMMLGFAGMDEDDPPEFTKEKNFVIPVGGGKYVMIPYPLGYNVLPTIGRLSMDMVTSGKPTKKLIDMLGAVVDAFNPLGSSGLALTMSPTIADPFLSVWANRDAFGRPIYRQDMSNNPTPGYTRSRESTLAITNLIAEFLNRASGGTKYQKGAISPTADEIEYLAGQFTGGVGREALKAAATAKAAVTGEELPPYKIPVVGKILGDTGSSANIANKFYENVKNLADMEHEIKGRQEHREDVRGFMREHPESRLWNTANGLENQVNSINREIRDLQKQEGQDQRIQRLRDQKTRIMKQFNIRFDNLAK